MKPAKLVIFDDEGGKWGPLTDLQPIFDLRSGAVTTRERIERVLGQTASALIVPKALQAVVAQRSGINVNQLAHNGETILANGRWLAVNGVECVRGLSVGSVLRQTDGQVVAARLGAVSLPILEDRLFSDLTAVETDEQLLVERPWEIVEGLDEALRADLAASKLPRFLEQIPGVPTVGDHPIRVASSAKLHPMVLINAEKGPVAIDDGAIIGSYAVVAGPCYIGRDAVIAPHAHMRSVTVIGPSSVAAGEIANTVIQGYSNKSHAGFLGHSIVGRWVNFGANTTVSNLKNTYGRVRVQLDADGTEEDSELIKVGPIIGDYVRTAIGTRLATGACVGTGSMLAVSGFTPKFIDRFSFFTDAGCQPHDIEGLLAIAERMMSRRGCQLLPAERARFRYLASPADSAIV